MRTIRVLVVDDSALMRKMIPRILQGDPCLEVVGTAMDGLFALKKIRDLKPDVVTLDISMPRMDGIDTLRQIVTEHGIPTVIVSSFAQREAEQTLEALEIGAFDFVTKPQDALSIHIETIGSELVEKVKAAFESPLARLTMRRARMPLSAAAKGEKPGTAATAVAAGGLLAVAASTGGPNAINQILPRIPADFPWGVMIVQHMPPGFTGTFATRLNAVCALEVKEARDGDMIRPGRALVAPGDRHLQVRREPLGPVAALGTGAPRNGHRPSADVMFHSVAAEFGGRAIGLILTGMGNDGAAGIGAIRAQGGCAVAQDEESCVVYGMPRAAIEGDHVDHVMSLEGIGDWLSNNCSGKENEYGRVCCP